MTSFLLWLMEQQPRRDDVGEIARIVSRDTCLVSHDYQGVRRHLGRGHRAPQMILAALRVANDEYQRGEAR